MEQLPGELVIQIFEYLGVGDLVNCSKVCVKWRQLASLSSLWEQKALCRWKLWDHIASETTKEEHWFSIFKTRYQQDQEIPSLIEALISPQTRDKAMTMILGYGINVFEKVQNFLHFLESDQPIPPELTGTYSVPPYVKHISLIHRAGSVFDLLHSCCFESRCRRLIHTEEEEDTLEELATMLSEWGTQLPGSIVTDKLNEIAIGFPSFVSQVTDSPLEVLLHEQQSRLVEVLLEYLADYIGFQGSESDYYNPNNSFLHKLLETKKGIPITLCILFKAIGQRNGIHDLHLLNSPRHVVIAYFPPAAKPVMIVDVFNNRIMDLQSLNSFLMVTYSPTTLPIASADEMLYRMLGNLRQIYKSLLDSKLVSVISFMLLIKEQPNDYILRILLNKSRGFSQLALKDYYRIKELDCFEPEVLSRLEAHILNDSDSGNGRGNEIRIRSSEENKHVQWKVGHVFRHARYGYRGVIFGWDPKCLSSTEWVQQMRVDSLPHGTEQPFYSVLVDTRDNHGQITYVAEDNIGVACHDLIHHPEMGLYFDSYNFETNSYIPNEYWLQQFPEG